ncbi:MAG: threonine ammonia-lyase [Defluviitaleaceae bacterium]|nr:threonine ammonia-lyase [Defluviitaleaceae bacterium]
MEKLTLEKVRHAQTVLADVARKTDLIDAYQLECQAQVYLKTENLQATGSFKLRGATYKISQLSDEEKKAGIIACSAGNHAQGVALAASKAGLTCTICMPDGAPISKVEATKALGAVVELVNGTYDDAYEHARHLQQASKATFVHPFDDVDVMAGQGTIALEIFEQLEGVEAVVIPIGGGGLIGGMAYTIKTLYPTIKVYGVQAENAASMANSVAMGHPMRIHTVATFADGIAVKTPGVQTLALVKQHVDAIVTVTEDEIATAILTLMEKQKLVAEGAGATAVAALLFNKLPVAGKRVVAIVSGGNIDVNILSRVITRGLITSGRQHTLEIALEDKPGQLVGVSRAIEQCGANVIRVDYTDSDPNTSVTSCVLKVGIETRGFSQIEAVEETLRAAGFNPTSSSL